jgi:hypothetical protein
MPYDYKFEKTSLGTIQEDSAKWVAEGYEIHDVLAVDDYPTLGDPRTVLLLVIRKLIRKPRKKKEQ